MDQFSMAVEDDASFVDTAMLLAETFSVEKFAQLVASGWRKRDFVLLLEITNRGSRHAIADLALQEGWDRDGLRAAVQLWLASNRRCPRSKEITELQERTGMSPAD